MGEQAKPSGPDLARGVPVASVKQGGSVAGQVDGEAVLLVRREDEWLAIGATCSHYSGPLGEGLIVGDTVRCPWHHACFSLRTGEALRPPALNPVACYRSRCRATRCGSPARSARTPAAPAATEGRARLGRDRGRRGRRRQRRGDAAARGLWRAHHDRGSGRRRALRPTQLLQGLSRGQRARRTGCRCARRNRIATRASSACAGRGWRRSVRATGASSWTTASSRDYGALLLATGATPVRLGPERGPRRHAGALPPVPPDSRAIIAAAREGAPRGRRRGELHRARGGRVAPRAQDGSARGGAGDSSARAGHGPGARRFHPRPARGARRPLPPGAEAGRDRRGRRHPRAGRAARRRPGRGRASACGPTSSWRRARGWRWTAA